MQKMATCMRHRRFQWVASALGLLKPQRIRRLFRPISVRAIRCGGDDVAKRAHATWSVGCGRAAEGSQRGARSKQGPEVAKGGGDRSGRLPTAGDNGHRDGCRGNRPISVRVAPRCRLEPGCASTKADERRALIKIGGENI